MKFLNASFPFLSSSQQLAELCYGPHFKRTLTLRELDGTSLFHTPHNLIVSKILATKCLRSPFFCILTLIPWLSCMFSESQDHAHLPSTGQDA
jgi:hypothetical protein